MKQSDISAHYKQTKLEPFDVIADWFTPEEYRAFLKGNVIKYIYRAGRKGPADIDLMKAEDYLRRLRLTYEEAAREKAKLSDYGSVIRPEARRGANM